MRISIQRVTLLLAAALLLLVASGALAQSGDGHDLSWNTVDGGGCTFCRGGGYTLSGTAGQPDAGAMTGGGFTLGGGFWRGGGLTWRYLLYLPLTMRGY
jgi:hypothetical protein